jgi:protein-tyrosine-phosphatase
VKRTIVRARDACGRPLQAALSVLLEPPRAAARGVRFTQAALDRLLHGPRHRRALGRLATLAPLRTVLFVCHGNIYRSPYAEHRFRATVAALGAAAPLASSAGFSGPDRPSPDEAIAAAARGGVDISAHRSRLLTGEAARASDLVVVMDSRQARKVERLTGHSQGIPVLVLGDLDPDPIPSRAIVDPWGRGDSVLLEVYQRVDRCVAILARSVVAPPPPQPSPDRVPVSGRPNGHRAG